MSLDLPMALRARPPAGHARQVKRAVSPPSCVPFVLLLLLPAAATRRDC
jgi:hypothetical protein